MFNISIFKILLFSFLLYGVFSCKEDAYLKKLDNQLPNWQLTVYDSLVVPTIGRTVYIMDEDSINGLFLGLEPDWKTYTILNDRGERISSNTVVGEGPQRVSKIAKIGFTASGGVFVVGNSKMILFSSLDTITHSFDPQHSLPFPNFQTLVSIGDSTVIYSSVNDNYDSLTPEFFAHSHTMSQANIYNGDIRNFAPFRPESIYQKHIIPLDIFPHFSVSKDSIYLLYPYDGNSLYLYDGNGEFSRSISLFPLYFTPMEYPTGDDITDQLLFDQKNSSYKQLLVNDNYVITRYTRPMPEELRTVNIARVNSLKGVRESYLEIYNKSGQKLCKDILLPPEVLKIWAAPTLTELLLLRRFDINEDNIVLYKASLKVKS